MSLPMEWRLKYGYMLAPRYTGVDTELDFRGGLHCLSYVRFFFWWAWPQGRGDRVGVRV